MGSRGGGLEMRTLRWTGQACLALENISCFTGAMPRITELHPCVVAASCKDPLR